MTRRPVREADDFSPGPSGRIPETPEPRHSIASRVRGQLTRFPGVCAIFLVRLYQWMLSPLLGKTCRFHPSCSQYFVLAVRKYGLVRAIWKGGLRICRCHPWHPGGFDPP